MTDLSGLDIARLLKDAKELSQITHSGRPDLSCGKGCKYLYYHQSCAVLALIERLEKAEAERDNLAALIRRLAVYVPKGAPVRICANDYLVRAGLSGNPFRGEAENETDE